jgi:hypothetical protein
VNNITKFLKIILFRENPKRERKKKKEKSWDGSPPPPKGHQFYHQIVLNFSILRQKKEELWKLKYFTKQKYNLQKIL